MGAAYLGSRNVASSSPSSSMALPEEDRGRTFRLGAASPLSARGPSVEGPSAKEDSHASNSRGNAFDGDTFAGWVSLAGDGGAPVPAVGLATWQFA